MQTFNEIVAHIVLKEYEIIVIAKDDKESNPYEIYVKRTGARHFELINEYATMESVIIWIGGLYEGKMLDMNDNVCALEFEGICD